MVNITAKKQLLLKLAGWMPKSDEEFERGLESVKCVVGGYDKATDELTLETTPDRPDLLSVYGVARALKGALGTETGVPKHDFPTSQVEYFAEAEALAVRPFVAGAVIEGVFFDDDSIAELFQRQEKLDFTIGRRRKRVSIGLYDLDKLSPPFYFKAFDASFKYTPLKSTSPMSLSEILTRHETGVKYGHLAGKGPKYPVLVDSREQVLALIPVVNNLDNAVTTATTSLFIDMTGTDGHALNAAMNILCHDFADAGAKVSRIKVHYPNGKTQLTPDPTPSEMTLSVDYANNTLGTTLSPTALAQSLLRQRITARVQGNSVIASIPAYRSDFLHPIDLVEEVAMGIGYNVFEPIATRVFTNGGISPKTEKENFARDFLAGAGFLEVSTHVLSNEEKIRRAKSAEEFVEIANPVSSEYHVMRATLLPNLLEVLCQNTHIEYPQKIFEAGEVVVHNAKLPERMQTKLHLAAASCHASANLSEVASVLCEFAKRLGKKVVFEKLSSPQFIEGRAAKVLIDSKPVGQMGEVNPGVLTAFGVSVPCAVFEIELP
jgi:phenylalanyl-tRNA synthetase beta chain